MNMVTAMHGSILYSRTLAASNRILEVILRVWVVSGNVVTTDGSSLR